VRHPESMTRHLTKALIRLAPVLLAAAMPSCGGNGTPPPKPTISVTVSPDSVPVQTGAALQFTATVTNAVQSSKRCRKGVSDRNTSAPAKTELSGESRKGGHTQCRNK
jgi:hypothetical protein